MVDVVYHLKKQLLKKAFVVAPVGPKEHKSWFGYPCKETPVTAERTLSYRYVFVNKLRKNALFGFAVLITGKCWEKMVDVQGE